MDLFEKVPSIESRRDYVGASQVGDDCLRRAQLQYKQGSVVEGRMARIFDSGHHLEEAIIKWMVSSGFEISDRQLSFELLDGKFKGHCDGIITKAPKEFEIDKPCILEIKTANSTRFKSFKRYGVVLTSRQYAIQASLYQYGMTKENLDLINNEVFFLFYNKDTSELHYEKLAFNYDLALEGIENAKKIIESTELFEKISENRSHFKCMTCSFRDFCHPQSKDIAR